MATKLLFHLSEPDGVMPSDSMGNLEDLGAEGTPSTSVDAWTGKGRAFDNGLATAHVAGDVPGRDTLLQRDVTVQAIITAPTELGEPMGTIICRGLADGGAAERYCYGLELGDVPLDGLAHEVRWFWQDSAGNLKTQPGGTFTSPGTGKFFLLTATRRWERADKVVVRYYVNDELISVFETADGDIGGGTTGHTTIGARKVAGVYSNFFNGTIDELKVTDYEMSHEEIRETWKRLSEHQPAGVAMFTALAPPGIDWGKDPNSNLGRRVKISGQALGLANANTEEMRAMLLPDLPSLEYIQRWESICGLAPLPNDSLDVRRTRLVSYLSREEGFSHPAVKLALEGPLATTSANLEIVEYTNEVEFAEMLTSAIVEPAASWTLVGNALRVSVAAGQDTRWETVRLGRHMRTPIDANAGTLATIPGRAFVAAKIAAYTLQLNTGAGLFLWNARKSTGVWFGIFNNDDDFNGVGVVQLGYRTVVDSVLGPWVSLSTPWAATPVWLRFDLLEPDVLLDPVGGRRAVFSYSIVGPNAGFVDSAPVNLTGAGFGELEWAGFAAFGITAAVGGAGTTMDFEEFLAFCPNGLRPFNWYVFRDPGLGGEPDIVGARNLVTKMKPAHTHATVIEHRSVLCDNDRYGLCDRGPLGGL